MTELSEQAPQDNRRLNQSHSVIERELDDEIFLPDLNLNLHRDRNMSMAYLNEKTSKISTSDQKDQMRKYDSVLQLKKPA